MKFNYALSISYVATHSRIFSTSRGTTYLMSDAYMTQYTKPISHMGSGLSTQQIPLYEPLWSSTICARIFYFPLPKNPFHSFLGVRLGRHFFSIFQNCLDSIFEFRLFLASAFSSPVLQFNQPIPLNVQAGFGWSFLWIFLWSHPYFSQWLLTSFDICFYLLSILHFQLHTYIKSFSRHFRKILAADQLFEGFKSCFCLFHSCASL